MSQAWKQLIRTDEDMTRVELEITRLLRCERGQCELFRSAAYQRLRICAAYRIPLPSNSRMVVKHKGLRIILEDYTDMHYTITLEWAEDSQETIQSMHREFRVAMCADSDIVESTCRKRKKHFIAAGSV